MKKIMFLVLATTLIITGCTSISIEDINSIISDDGTVSAMLTVYDGGENVVENYQLKASLGDDGMLKVDAFLLNATEKVVEVDGEPTESSGDNKVDEYAEITPEIVDAIWQHIWLNVDWPEFYIELALNDINFIILEPIENLLHILIPVMNQSFSRAIGEQLLTVASEALETYNIGLYSLGIVFYMDESDSYTHIWRTTDFINGELYNKFTDEIIALNISEAIDYANVKTSEALPNADSYKFSAGYYTVGEDIPAGRYDIVWVSGYGNLYIKFNVNETFGDSANSIKEFKNVKLADGEVIEVNSSLVAMFIPK